MVGATTRRTALAVALAAAVVAVALPAAAPAKSGDLFVGNSTGGDVIRLRGEPPAQKSIAGGPPMDRPSGLVFAKKFLWVADFHFGVIRVNPRTGAQMPIAEGPPFVDAVDVDYGPNGRLYVADPFAYIGGAVFSVNPKTGKVRTVSKNKKFDRGPIAIVWHEKSLYVADQGGKILRVNPKTGRQFVLSDDSLLDHPRGIAFIRNRLYTNDGDNEVLRIKPNGKAVHVASTAPEDGLYDMCTGPKNGLLVAASSGAIMRIHPRQGVATYVSSGGLLNVPEGIALQP